MGRAAALSGSLVACCTGFGSALVKAQLKPDGLSSCHGDTRKPNVMLSSHEVLIRLLAVQCRAVQCRMLASCREP